MPVVVTHHVIAPWIDRIVGIENKFQAVTIAGVRVISIFIPCDHHWSLPVRVIIDILVFEILGKAIGSPNIHSISRGHPAHEVTQVF